MWKFQSLKGGCRGSSESTFVKMPHCWKSHAKAHFITTFYTSHQLVAIDDPGVVIPARSHTFVEIDHEMFIYGLSPPTADSRRAVASIG